MPEMLPKIKALRALYSGHIQVDGGINDQTAKMAREAGADVMVAGTYIFQAADARQAIASLKGTAPAPKRTGGHFSEGDCS